MTRITHVALALLLLGASTAASGQTYPSGPVKIVVPSAPGTQSDLVARAIAQRLAPVLGQPVLVDNRPGADGMLAVEAIVNAPPDGLTIANVQSGSLTLAPTLYPNRVRYDPERDLAAITHTVRATFILTVNSQLPVRNIKELVAHTKANPRTGALGHMPGVAYLAALVAKSVTEADIELIAYKGQPAIWTDLLGGRIHGGIEPVGGAFNQIRAGKLRAIALLGSARTALLPDVPTATEQGFPGMEVDAWNALFARAGTPPAIIDRLHREVVRILTAPDLVENMLSQGMELEVSNPATLAKRVRDDRAKWAKVVKEFNVKAEN
ncbi:MAG: Bug family tripartite tricarboxylate transporter substrate binding protein [Burkholderiales bacterium]